MPGTDTKGRYEIIIIALTALAIVPIATALASSQQPHQPAQPPTLIIRVTTTVADENREMVDRADLERQFAQQLERWGAKGAIPVATASQAGVVSPPTHRLDIVVTSLRKAKRLRMNKSVFCVDITLVVWNLEHAQPVGRISAYTEEELRTLSVSEDEQTAIVRAIADLAKRFVSGASDGEFGPELTTIHPSIWGHVERRYVVAFLFAAMLFFLALLLACVAPSTAQLQQQQANITRERKRLARQRRYRRRYEEAQALAHVTDGFSEAACQERALNGFADVLQARAAIEEDEVKRLRNSYAVEAKYAEMAKAVAAESDMSEHAIVDMLRASDEWPYRVLQNALKISQEK